MRRTKIICTLGPAVDSEEMIRTLIRTGMDAARFNFSHGSHPEHLERLNMLKSVRDAMGRPVATILDTKGPEYRIRTFEEGRITLAEGDVFTFTTEPVVGTRERVAVSYAGLMGDLAVGDTILLNNGLMSFRVEALGEDGTWRTVYETDSNRQRLIRRRIDQTALAVRLIPLSTYQSEKKQEDYGSSSVHLFAFEVF